MPKQPLVVIQNMCKAYAMPSGIVQALKQINLSIAEGESVAIMGPSGSGKSTLLHLLGCLDRPSSGKYLLNGADVSLMDDLELSHMRAMQIGFVFQSFNLIPTLNLYHNVRLPFLYRDKRFTESEIEKQVLRSLEMVKLSHRRYHLPSQLSGGEMQRAAIARALAIDPLIILADEPTGNLDSETGQAILQLFQELHAQGRTFVIVTHDPCVASSCQRTILMNDGEVSNVSLP